ncbi:hypothetical protein PPROV_000940900 [Pycnococcus provasolii]|uniref:Uncharacterized protein n=1 Tax=Pycnococcus provasolii TaxID=41880 RepID=A0A830HUQ1_9CHLO|nr:hypothetical protein PPROV_000940900 [Pycnococcus provasolii]
MFQKAKSAASSAASAAASKAALVANEQATKARTTIDAEMPKYQAQFAAASEQTRAAVKEGFNKLEPQVQTFLRSPTMQHLKKNEAGIKAGLAVFVAAGLPGAALLLSLVSYVGLEACGDVLVQFFQLAVPLL